MRKSKEELLAQYPNLTTTQVRIMEMLSDGKRHLMKLMAQKCLDTPTKNNLIRHVVFLRRDHLADDEAIICELFKRNYYYRHVKLIVPGSYTTDGPG